MQDWKREKTPIEIHGLLRDQRVADGVEPPCLTTVRKALRGITHRRGRSETRGRKRKVRARGIEAMDRARIRLQAKADGEHEVTWKQVIKSSRIKKVGPTTASRRMADAGKDIKWRRPREKPQRSDKQDEARARWCGRNRFLPNDFLSDSVDLIIDNKLWPIPTTAEAKKHLRRQKVRGHLRTRGEGLKKGYTKPSAKKHRRNLGGSVSVCAAIHRDRVVMWEYLPSRWCAQAAVDLYNGPIRRTLRRVCGAKSRYLILEDNDPHRAQVQRRHACQEEPRHRHLRPPWILA